MKSFIPIYKPYIGKKESAAVLRVLKSGKLSRGKEIEKFEKEFARYCKKKYAIAVNSGTSGLHLGVRALGWKKGDEIITTPFSYISSANVLLLEGITPVFVDIALNTLNIDINKIEEKITPRTKGILLVHVFGLPVNFDKIKEIKDKYGLLIIEDACEAIGKPNKRYSVNRIGEITVYGFFENKQLTSGGEGGMIVTDNLEIAQKCRAMRDNGRSFKKDWINYVILGFNFRMTEMQAAFGREQLKFIDKFLKKRSIIAEKYSYGFRNVKDLVIPNQDSFNERSWFLYFIIFKTPKTREKIYKALLANGISSNKNYFPPIYNFPMYKNYKKDCKNTEVISETILALPMFYEMGCSQVEKIVNIIKKKLKS